MKLNEMMTSFTLCNNKTAACIQYRVHQLSVLLDNYRWLVDSYVSDFYTAQHWENLPRSLQEYFDNVDPTHFAWLLVKQESRVNNRLIPPLILLALHCCIQDVSLSRNGVNIESIRTQETISSALLDTSSETFSPDNQKDASLYGAFVEAECIQQPNYKNGQCMDMDYMFRKHVKPKKQHEISKLGQAVKLLSKASNTSHVIDVGAGLGHLSRVLTFQHGLKVTTVEAADGHAPKAASYDKEAKEDRRKMLSNSASSTESLCAEKTKEKKNRLETTQNNSTECLLIECSSSNVNTISDGQGLQFLEKQNCSLDAELAVSPNGNLDKKLSKETTEADDTKDLPSHVICKVDPDIEASRFVDIVRLHRDDKGESQFTLVGLHACGDLTPTLLRVFVDCPEAVAMASVACCYMKISTESGTSLANFPMSKFVQSLSCSNLSYVSRELACHFADAYYQRLKANSPHLKIHSYRAALQCILRSVNPEFKNGDYRFVSKKGSRGTFTQYATDILKKVGFDTSTVPQELYQNCETITEDWKRVVAFYTLRLSLAPVVETYILLDRVLFLKEKGVTNILVPIFDSSISPRNFALLAVKDNNSAV